MLTRLMALLIAAILLDVAPPGDDSDSGCSCNDDDMGMRDIDTKSDTQPDSGAKIDSDPDEEQLKPALPQRR